MTGDPDQKAEMMPGVGGFVAGCVGLCRDSHGPGRNRAAAPQSGAKGLWQERDAKSVPNPPTPEQIGQPFRSRGLAARATRASN